MDPGITKANVPFSLSNGRRFSVRALSSKDIEDLHMEVKKMFVDERYQLIPESVQGNARNALLKDILAEAEKLKWYSGKGAEIICSPRGLTRVIWQGLVENISLEDFQEMVTTSKELSKDLNEMHRAFTMANLTDVKKTSRAKQAKRKKKTKSSATKKSSGS